MFGQAAFRNANRERHQSSRSNCWSVQSLQYERLIIHKSSEEWMFTQTVQCSEKLKQKKNRNKTPTATYQIVQTSGPQLVGRGLFLGKMFRIKIQRFHFISSSAVVLMSMCLMMSVLNLRLK